LNSVKVTDGLKKDGWVLINTDTENPLENLKLGKGFNIATVNATAIAVKYGLGSRTSSIVNTTMLGAFCGLPFGPDISVLKNTIKDKITIKTNNNLLAADEGCKSVKIYQN
jgi:Pyruvate/2-oxoacid:ferredoxin oxidoreductase gamma subunit